MAGGTLGELNIKIAANVAQLSQDVSKVEREMRKMRTAGVKASKQMDTASKAVTGFKKLAVGIASVTVAWRTLSGLVSSSITAFQAQEDAEIKLETALGGVNQGLLDQASALQKVTRFGDEAIIEAQALIGAFIKDEDQIKKATAATLDLAAAKGFDLVAAADLVSKTLGSSTNALTRYGIEVKGAVGSTERLNSAVTNISDKFGGQAAAQAGTMAGRVEQMNNAWGDMQETLVGLVAPALTNFAEKMVPIINQISDFIQGIKEARDEARAMHGEFGEGGLFGMDESEGEEPQQIVEARKVRARRELQLTEDLEKAKSNLRAQEQRRAAAEAAANRAAEFAEQLEEGQAQWELELKIEQDKDRLREMMHQRQLDRDKTEKQSNLDKIQTASRVARGMIGSIATIARANTANQKTQLRIAKAMGTVDAIGAALNAFRNAPYPYNYVAAGLALAAGMSKVSQMGSGGATGMGTAPEPPQADLDSLLADQQKQAQLNTTQTTIVFQGGTFVGGDKDALARDLAPAVETALSDGVR
jgi:hypothetical protein